MVWPFVSGRERVRRQAADWFAKLRGPDADALRPSFERWRQQAEHTEAYDRIAGRYEAAGLLSQSEVGRARRLGDRAGPSWRAGRYAFAAILICIAAAVAYLVAARPGVPGDPRRLQVASFSASGSQGRSLILADGSRVILTPGSAVDIALGRDQRRLRLLRGEGRFSVAHEARPFIVSAEGTEVVAHGTEFVVRLAGRSTTVSLIEGSIDVIYPVGENPVGERRTARLKPGQRLTVAPSTETAAPVAAAQAAGKAAPAMLDFDDTPLSEAIARANAEGRPNLRLGDPALGALRVTGAFRAGDTRSLAASLAAAFDLERHEAEDAIVLVRSSRKASQPR